MSYRNDMHSQLAGGLAIGGLAGALLHSVIGWWSVAVYVAVCLVLSYRWAVSRSTP